MGVVQTAVSLGGACLGVLTGGGVEEEAGPSNDGKEGHQEEHHDTRLRSPSALCSWVTNLVHFHVTINEPQERYGRGPPDPSAWSKRLSTFCPSNIAELLRPSPQSISAQRTPRDNEALTINGYVRTVRKQKRIAFAAIGDGSTLQTVQAVLPPQLAEGLSTGVAVTVTGKWTPSPGQGQSHELQVNQVQILGENDATAYPIQKKYQSPEFLRTLPHLRSRLPINSLILRLRSLVTAQVTNYFAEHDFVQCHPPIITSSDCEGAGEVFTVAPEVPSSSDKSSSNQIKKHEDMFFGSPKYLTVSSQLHLEALAQSVNKVWTLSPTFRAEKSDTARHLSEFYMLEAELAFVDDANVVMDVVEEMLRSVALKLQESVVGQELLEARARDQDQESTSVSHATLAQRWQGLAEGPWPRISYAVAIRHLKDAVAQGKVGFEYAPGHEDGLQTEHERFLAESLGRGGPIFVTDYPRNIKPFYMAPSNDLTVDESAAPTVACFDLLVPEICELVGGSMREHRLEQLLKSMEEQGLQQASDDSTDASDSSLQWYVDLRRYGSVPHGGFGLGFDRLLCYLAGVPNIRDVVSFPRWHKRCDC
ncbi:asparaginyl-tRNA synthetase [Alternaria alternata]|nr:asparaginyl-tRNA synthetase [Alternaria alternata]